MTDFAVVPPGKAARMLPVALAAIVPAAILGAAFLAGRLRELQEAWFVLVIIPLVIGVLVLGAARRHISLESGRLRVEAALYTRNVALGEIDLPNARILDLREHREARPWLKTNGYAVPGFQAGHFRGRHRRKLFCLITAPRVVELPLHDGGALLLSAERPQALLDALRTAAGR